MLFICVNDHLRNYISHIISDYDKIHISVTKIFILINCLKYLLLIKCLKIYIYLVLY